MKFHPAFTRFCAPLLLVMAGLVGLPAHAAGSSAKEVVTTPHVRAELVAHAPDGVSPGATIWVGLQLAHQPEWHTYWKNAGDSGLPTELTWTLPAGVEAGDIAWPLPRKIPIGTLANYGYEGTVLLPVPLTITPDFKMPLMASSTSELDIQLKASWLVCRKECIPEEGEFALRLPLRSSTAFNASAFEQARAAQPQALAGDSRVEVVGQALQVSVKGLPASAHGKTLEFFPETPELIHTAAVSGKDWKQQWDGPVWNATIPLAEHRSQSPDHLPLVLALADADRAPGQPWGWRTQATVSGTWPATATATPVSAALQAALDNNAAAPAIAQPTAVSTGTFVLALLGALIGGMLLNLMPCVFPVLAIKVLGFARHTDDRRAHRRAGWAYTAGVVLSFLLLGAAMLGLRAAGAELGWGFQLQSPVVVASLAALFTLIGLNLAGVFEFGQFVPSSVASAQARNPLVNDFLSGVLAVVVASPCTAPFMGASLGLALGLPALQALALFAALGVGLALPYLVASLVPAFARMLPRPGVWMHTLRRLLAFPMFATVAWLVWVLGQQSGIDGAGALLALLVALSAVVWALTLQGRTRLVLAPVMGGLFVLLAAGIGSAVVTPPAALAADTTGSTARWQAWSAPQVEALTASGKPVFVDFTAAWCVTCQVNKKTTLSNDDVLADFDTRKVALLRADWTRRDPAITAALAALGRNGVPVYVLYRPGQAPLVMTEILSPGEVRAALATL